MKRILEYAEWLDKNADVEGKYNLSFRLAKWVEEYMEYKFHTTLEHLVDEVGDLTTVTAFLCNCIEMREVPMITYGRTNWNLWQCAQFFQKQLAQATIGKPLDKEEIERATTDICLQLDKVHWLNDVIEDKKLEFGIKKDC